MGLKYLFRTRYKVVREGERFYCIYYRYWFLPFWNYITYKCTLEEAIDRIQIEKELPLYEE